MSSSVHQLVVSLVDDLFGPICAKTVSTVLQNCNTTLKDIIEKTGFDRRTVNQCLCVLVKHRFIQYEEVGEKTPIVRYSIDLGHALTLPLYPLFVSMVKQHHGDTAEIILEEVLHQGITTKEAVLETCLGRLATTSKEPITADSLKSLFDVLVSRGYIEKTVQDSDPTYEPPAKKKRTNNLWRVNSNIFHTCLRDTHLIEFMKNRFDDGAADVVSVILNLNSQLEGDMAQVSSAATYDQILHGLKSRKAELVPFAKSYLDVLVNSDMGIVKMIEEFGGGSFIVHFGKFYEEYTKHHIRSIVKERFGPKCHRVFSIVVAQKMIEQKQVAELALLPYKDAKELLYSLYTENFLELQELHRTPDFSPLRTFYLFHAPLEKLRQKLLSTCYKAVFNLMELRKQKLNENSRLVEKSLRADAAVLQATQKGIPPDQLEDMLTSSEKQQLAGCMRLVKTLDLGEISVVDTILALTHFGTMPIS